MRRLRTGSYGPAAADVTRPGGNTVVRLLLLGLVALVLEARIRRGRSSAMRSCGVLSQRCGTGQRTRITRLRFVASSASFWLISSLLDFIHEHRQVRRHVLELRRI